VRVQRAAQSALAVVAWLWIAAVVFAPWLVFPLGHVVCHQRPERSFFFRGHQFAVCARCTGLYFGAALSVPFAIAVGRALESERARWRLGLAALPTALTWSLEFGGIVPFSNLSRFVAALPLGAVAAWLVVAQLTPGAPQSGPRDPRPATRVR